MNIENINGKDLSYISFFDYIKAMSSIQSGHRFIKKYRAGKFIEKGEYEEMVMLMKTLPTAVERIHKQSLEILEKINHDSK